MESQLSHSRGWRKKDSAMEITRQALGIKRTTSYFESRMDLKLDVPDLKDCQCL